MNTPNDGGEAFPTYYHDILPEIGPVVRETHPGMTLRDYFAAAALTGLMADATNSSPIPMNAETAYRHADAMLAERAKTKEKQP